MWNNAIDRLTELQAFVAIVEEGSLAGAARRLGRSPPAITRNLSELEARTGVVLIERSTRRCQPTDAGRRLAEQARLLLSGYDEAIAEASGEATLPAGLIRVTAPLVFGREHVAPLVAQFLDTFPSIIVDLQLADRVVDLHDENFDLGVRIGKVADASLIALRIGEVRSVAVASPAYLEKRGVPKNPEDILKHDIVQHTTLGASAPWVFRAPNGAAKTVNATARLAINQADAAIAAARAGRGIVRALSYQVADDLQKGQLVRVLRAFEPEAMPVNLVWPDSRRSIRRVRLLIDHLKTLRSLAVLHPEVG